MYQCAKSQSHFEGMGLTLMGQIHLYQEEVAVIIQI